MMADKAVEAMARAIEAVATEKRGFIAVEDAADLIAALQESGMVIVPEVPTEGMLDAFVARALSVSISGDGGWSNYGREQWKTMIQAAKEL